MVKNLDPAEVAAILPVYEQGEGNGALIVLTDGSSYQLQRRVRTILRQLARKRKLDLQLLSDEGGKVTGRKNLAPIAFTPSLVFLPLKTRRPLIRGDGAYGYFNLNQIRSIEFNEGILCILQCGMKVPLLMQPQSISRQVKDAIYLSSFLHSSSKGTSSAEESDNKHKLLDYLEKL